MLVKQHLHFILQSAHQLHRRRVLGIRGPYQPGFKVTPQHAVQCGCGQLPKHFALGQPDTWLPGMQGNAIFQKIARHGAQQRIGLFDTDGASIHQHDLAIAHMPVAHMNPGPSLSRRRLRVKLLRGLCGPGKQAVGVWPAQGLGQHVLMGRRQARGVPLLLASPLGVLQPLAQVRQLQAGQGRGPVGRVFGGQGAGHNRGLGVRMHA